MARNTQVAADLDAPPITQRLARFVATHPSRGWSDVVSRAMLATSCARAVQTISSSRVLPSRLPSPAHEGGVGVGAHPECPHEQLERRPLRGRHEGPHRGTRRRARPAGGGAKDATRRRFPAVHHRDGLGHALDPTGPGSADPQPRYHRAAGRARFRLRRDDGEPPRQRHDAERGHVAAAAAHRDRAVAPAAGAHQRTNRNCSPSRGGRRSRPAAQR